MNGISTVSDICEWNYYMGHVAVGGAVVDSEIIKYSLVAFNDIYIEYLLKHFPQDAELRIIYKTDKDIADARKRLYRKMLVCALGESIRITKRWDFEHKEEYEGFISRIKEYVGGNVNILVETEKYHELSDEGVFNLIKEISRFVPQKTKDQKGWFLRIGNLNTFLVA